MTSGMSEKKLAEKIIIISHGVVGTLRKHIRKTLSETVNYLKILSILENKESLKCQSRS